MKKLMIAGALLTLISGCATKEYVHDFVQSKLTPIDARDTRQDGQIGALQIQDAQLAARIDGVTFQVEGVSSRVDGVTSRVDGMDGRLGDYGRQIANHEKWLDAHTTQISANQAGVAGVQATARDALERAMAAGRLAEGKFVYETVLNDGTLRFPLGKPTLSAEGMKALDAFAARLRGENRNVYVEIQGHTDNTGSAAGNQALGLARAEAVRHYLATHGAVPLHRMDVISYGATVPLAENKSRKGREQNRRVVLVVLK
ncbi:MAG: OmpA family protein [Betaproteobacteria bacterium]|nr:OmpA family protein [Betaproteobacteria bacterium]